MQGRKMIATAGQTFEELRHAITSCKESGNTPEYHFAGAGKMILHACSGNSITEFNSDKRE